MKELKILVLLVLVCSLGAGCTVSIKDSHELNVLEAETDIMKYNSVNDASNKDGQVNNQLTLVGQAKFPSQTTVTRQVPVTTTTAAIPTPPPRPVYGRACKAVPRTPPCAPPIQKTEMKAVPETTVTYRGPEVLATSSAKGPSTAHDVAAAVPGAVGNAVGMTTFGTTFGVAQRVGKTVINSGNQLGQQQGQTTDNDVLGINKNSTAIGIDNKAISGSSSAADASAISGKGH